MYRVLAMTNTMETDYDPQLNVLSLQLAHGKVVESDEIQPGVIVDYDKNGRLIGVEILDASRVIPDFKRSRRSVVAA